MSSEQDKPRFCALHSNAGLDANRKKVRNQHTEAFVYLSDYGFHIAKSERMCAPTIGSGKTEAEAWAEAANAKVTGAEGVRVEGTDMRKEE